MKISISKYYFESKSIFGRDSLQKSQNFEIEEFKDLRKELGQIKGLQKAEIKSVIEEHYDSRMNKPGGPLFYGGGIDTLTIIETISIQLGTLLAILRVLKNLTPIIEKYIEKRCGRSIKIDLGSKGKIEVENKKDLDFAIQKLKELSKLDKKSNNKKGNI